MRQTSTRTKIVIRSVAALVTAMASAGHADCQEWAIRTYGATISAGQISVGGGFTAEANVRISQPLPASNLTLFHRYINGGQIAEHKSAYVRPDGSIGFIYAGSPWPDRSSPAGLVPNDGEWHHVAVTREGSGVYRFFVDGVLAYQGGPGPCIPVGFPPGFCGITGYNGGTTLISGDGYDISAYRASNIARYSSNFTPPSAFVSDANALAVLALNEGGGAQTADSSGNHGVLDISGTFEWVLVGGDCNLNGVSDLDDISTGTSLDCNGNNIPDECELAAGTEFDCNGNGVLDSCDLAAGAELDCNGNGIPDSCDLASGASLDCDSNGIPDECDIASGASDCDADGVPDACQITGDATLDLNANGSLDGCEAIGTKYCAPAIANSTGVPAAILALGSEAVASNDLTMTVSGLPLNTFAMFVTSQTQGYAFPVPGSQGALCVTGFPGRFSRPGQIQSSGSSGSLVFPVDLTSLPTPIGFTAAQPGDTWNFQAWYRDANPTVTSNFTDAVGITFQ